MNLYIMAHSIFFQMSMAGPPAASPPALPAAPIRPHQQTRKEPDLDQDRIITTGESTTVHHRSRRGPVRVRRSSAEAGSGSSSENDFPYLRDEKNI